MILNQHFFFVKDLTNQTKILENKKFKKFINVTYLHKELYHAKKSLKRFTYHFGSYNCIKF